MKAIFGPNTPRVLQLLTRMRKLSPAEIDRVATSWNQASALDRAQAWAHLTAAAKEDCPVMAAASAARRAAMETARTLGGSDWAFWAAAWDAGAALITVGHEGLSVGVDVVIHTEQEGPPSFKIIGRVASPTSMGSTASPRSRRRGPR